MKAENKANFLGLSAFARPDIYEPDLLFLYLIIRLVNHWIYETINQKCLLQSRQLTTELEHH